MGEILTPNMLRLGRINTRALSGPLRLPTGASEMVEKVIKAYEAWFKIGVTAIFPSSYLNPSGSEMTLI